MSNAASYQKLYLILFGLILVTFQTSFFAVLLGPELNINLFAVVVLALLFSNRTEEAYVFALVCGVFLDTISASTIGISALYLSAVITTYRFISGFYIRSNSSKFVFGFLSLYLFKLILARSLDTSLALTASSVFGTLLAIGLKFRLFAKDKFLS